MSGAPGPDRDVRLVETVVNPILRVLLRTPVARVIGGRLVLLSYRGRRSGVRFRTPVVTVQDGPDWVVTTYREGVTWWHNFERGHDAILWIRGDKQPVTGHAITDEPAVAEWLGEMRDRGEGRLLEFFGLPEDADDRALESAAGAIVVVRFSPRD